MALPQKITLSAEDWVQFESWYIKTYKKPLPDEFRSGYFYQMNPIYQNWLKAKAGGRPDIAPQGTYGQTGSWVEGTWQPKTDNATTMNQWLNLQPGALNPATMPGATGVAGATTPVAGKAEVVNLGGWLFLFTPGVGGLQDTYESLGRADTGDTNDAARLAETKRQFDETMKWNTQQASLQTIQERYDNALRFEKDRNSLLQELPTDDWISRYILENQPNPYQDKPVETPDLEVTLDRQTGNVQYQQNRLAEAIATGASAETIAEFQGYATEAAKLRDTTYGAWSRAKQEKRDWTPQPFPNAPEWLAKYAPGQTAGRMISPEDVITPSGQQLTGMGKQETSKLGFYADWASKMGGGRNWQDILNTVKISQPYTPQGAGSYNWQPSRQ